MDEKVKNMFYGLYPDSDPKYYDYFGFGRNINSNNKLESIDVWYQHGLKYNDYIHIIKGKNDRDSRWDKYLHSYNFPKIWRLGGDIPVYNGRAKLDCPINNFKVYVDDTNYFISKLPPISASWSKGKTINEKTIYNIRKAPLDYKSEPYFAMICGAYIASYLSGISLLNLGTNDTPKVITSIIKYHFYYQIRKFMRDPSLIDRYSVSQVREHIPTKKIDVDSIGKDDDGNEFIFNGYIENSNQDYLSFISNKSNGITQIGQELLQESIESFVYSVLGAQAKTRWSIMNKGAKSSQTQVVFRKIVEDTITQSDSTITISNMRRAIQACNVILNMAISPGIILIPSSMVILEKPIPGYNNILTISTSGMAFGINSKINYVGVKKDLPKKVHQPDKPITHLDNLDNTTEKVHQPEKKTPDDKLIVKREDNHNTELLTLLGISVLSTFVIVKYVV